MAGSRRNLGRRPVFDLDVLKRLISNGVLGEDEVWVATDRCLRDLENERWSYNDVLRMLISLEPGDFKHAEWCRVKGGELHPCDVYQLPFDFERRLRSPRGLEVYMKFSLTDEGRLGLVLVSCHGSR